MKVSILVVTYNHEKYIAEAIGSILVQRNNFETEIILLDDSSTDKTLEVASGILQDTQNKTIIKNDYNIGITRNYQKGFSLCKGEYVFVLEGDDYWIDPYKIKRQVEFLDDNPYCSVCFHPFLTQTHESGIFENHFRNENATYSDLFAINHMILNEGLIANFSVCSYRKSALNKLPVEIFNLTTYDWMVNISLAQFGFLGRINMPMSVYRHSETAVWSTKMLNEKLEETIRLIPGYDKALSYRYTALFNIKIQMLTDRINESKQINERQQVNRSSFRSFLPHVLIYIVKMVTPPVLLNLIRKR